MTYFDLKSHEGLRGAAAFWVMLFHCILYSKLELDFQGSSLMPLFFLLSGFSLAIGYGPKFPNEDSLINSFDTDTKANSFNFYNFYFNRVLRTYPVYFLLTLFAIPFYVAGYGSFSPNMVILGINLAVSIIPVCTLTIFLLGGSLDGPGWTVCTLLIMWLRFPVAMRNAKAKSNMELVNGIVKFYYIQLVVLFVVFFTLIASLGFWPAFCAATMNPISRYSVFLMGVYAGELSNRRTDDSGIPLWPESFAYLIPLFPGKYFCSNQTLPSNSEDQLSFWKNKAVKQSSFLLIATLLVSVLGIINKVIGTGGSILGGVWYQAIVPFSQLEVVISLVNDNGESLVSKVLRTPFGLWLGKISMTIYLLHWCLIYYLCWIVQGEKRTWPSNLTCSNNDDACIEEVDTFMQEGLIPIWGIPVVCVATLFLSQLIYTYYEEPIRKRFRKD